MSGPFILDDALSVVDNTLIRSPGLSAVVPERDSPVAGRPLVNLSFAANYAFGGLNVRGYHAVNLIIHLLVSCLAFGVVRRTLELPGLVDRFGQMARPLAFAVALIWVVHPLNSEVIEYVTQRTESMMTLFYLITIYASIRSIGAPRGLWQAAAVIACVLGMACKESMVTAPLMVALYDRVFVFDSWRRTFRRRRSLYAGLASSWLVLAMLIWSGPRGLSAGFSSDVSPWTYLLNQSVLIVRYLALVFWPRALVVNYGWPVSLTLVDVWPYATVVMIALLLTIVLYVTAPKLGFLAVFFFVTLAPSSSIVPIASEVGAERRMYLPLLALVALCVMSVALASHRLLSSLPDRSHRAPQVVFAGLLLAPAAGLFAGTVARNREYASRLTLFRTVVDRWPSSIAAHILGAELAASGSHEDAIVWLRAAVSGDPRAHYDLGVELFRTGMFDEAIDHFASLIRIWRVPPPSHPHWQPPLRIDVVSAQIYMGRALAKTQRESEAIEQYKSALTLDPSNVEAHGLLAEGRFHQQNFLEASLHYRAYLKARPEEPGVWTNFGVALASSGKLEEAAGAFRRAVELEPQNVLARRNLATALMDVGDVDGAVLEARRAVTLGPDDPAARKLLEDAVTLQKRSNARRR
jgi:Flp pilus assembly protein TadD